MNTNRDLNYRLFLQRNDGFTRTPFQNEFEQYVAIQSGEVGIVKKHFESIKPIFFEGKGKLSDDPVRNVMYHFVVSVAIISRLCVEAGLRHDTAYTLSDIYIQRADKCSDPYQIIDLLGEMQYDFAERMRALKKENVISIHVRKCIDYIYDHLHENLTVNTLADYVGLNPSYLSKLFSKETGLSIKEFTTKAKINTAENMLKNSDFSYLDISLSLGFSSQSAFISVFKKNTGVTPKEYKAQNYHNNISV